MSENEIDMGWLAAVMAPWAVAPHPNFRQDEVSSYAELALVVERRDREREREKYQVASDFTWEKGIVQAARESLVAETQEVASERLWAFAFDEEPDPAARVSAALFASLAYGELERPRQAAERLDELSSELRRLTPSGSTPEADLLRSAVSLQRTLRLIDGAAFAEARAENEAMHAELPPLRSTWTADFAVSTGIGWKAPRVLRDISEALRRSALSARSYLEQFEGQTWVSVIRGRSGWVETRQLAKAANRDQRLLKQSFESTYESTSGKRVFGRSPITESGYEALLAAELFGDHGRVNAAREALGKLHLLSRSGQDFSVREGLRLLRHANAISDLRPALQWVRSEGPAVELAADARLILDRVRRDGYVKEADLLVFEFAADFLSRDELAAALGASKLFPEVERLSSRPDWSVLDKAWKAMARLLPDSGEDNQVAVELLDLLQSDAYLEPMVPSLIAALRAIDWDAIPSSISAEWVRWSTEEVDGRVRDIQRAYREIRLPQTLDLDGVDGLMFAAVLADFDGKRPSQELIDDGLSKLSAAFDIERKGAHGGQYSFGGPEPLDVAVAFGLRYRSPVAWDLAIAQLTDAQIEGTVKERGLDRIANNAHRIPIPVRERMMSAWPDILTTAPRDRLFSSSSNLEIFPEALRAGGALGAITQSEWLRLILQMSSMGVQGKVEAAQSIPFAHWRNKDASSAALLLQLSYDDNPAVRAEAAFSLTQVLGGSNLSSQIADRLVELVDSDGVRIPASVLNGLRVSGGEIELDERLLGRVRVLSVDGPRVVRRIALDVLREIGED